MGIGAGRIMERSTSELGKRGFGTTDASESARSAPRLLAHDHDRSNNAKEQKIFDIGPLNGIADGQSADQWEKKQGEHCGGQARS